LVLSRAVPAFVLLLAACATPYQPFEGKPVLAAIRFEGNKTISGGELLNHIATAPTSGFFSKTARYYDADLFALDLKRIERWYNQKGFYQAKVKGIDELRDDVGRVTLLVHINEGKRAIIRKMDYVGLDAVPSGEMEDIDAALPIHAGDPFDEDGYEKAKDVLLQQLREHGFAQPQVGGKVEVMPDDGTAHVTFDAEPGERFKFGKVTVSGNRRVSADEIASSTGINKGDQFSPQALALAQQRVYNLGLFSGVRVGTEPLGDTPVAAVRVNVREAPFQTVRFGVGGSAETTRWELPRLSAEYINRSLFGGLRRLELASTVGYAFVPSLYQYDPAQSGITTQNSAQLVIPNFFRPGLEWINRMEYAREIQSGFSYDDVAARTGLLYRRGKHTVGLSLNFVRYFNVKVSGLDNLSQGDQGVQIVRDCGTGCTLTYPELRYSYDGRDNILEPTQGFYFGIGFQQTLKPGSFSYFRINPDVRAYAPFTRYAVLALRVNYGGLFTETADGPSPFTQRFFYGGQNEQRGYAALRQGPKYGSASCTVGKDTGCTQPYATVGIPAGGTGAALVSAEVRIRADWLLNNLRIVPFIDVSSVNNDPKSPWTRWQQVSSTGQITAEAGGAEIAPGLGVRYVTPFGPLRFDVGYVLNPRDVTTYPVEEDKLLTGIKTTTVVPTRVSSFCPGTTGCIHEARWAFHVSIGEAF
jgi:translocation and assembly module TamA